MISHLARRRTTVVRVLAGSQWTTRTAVGQYWMSVCWSPQVSLFVAVGGLSTLTAMTSPNGNTWTGRNVGVSNLTSVCWSPELNLFAAIPSSAQFIGLSANGISWTVITAPASIYGTWKAIVWSSELSLFLILEANGKIALSSNGTTWTLAATLPTSEAWQTLCWSPDRSLFVAVAGSRIGTSPDGLNWTIRTGVAGNWSSICWANGLGLFVAVSNGGTPAVMTSPDGVTWTGRTGITAPWFGLCWAQEQGLCVAVNANGHVMTSLDGINWTARTGVANEFWRSVVWSPQLSKFVAVSSGSVVMTSP